ncbi:hypothetical protein ACWIID_43435 [Streptomyces phaeochromogenes]
MLNSVWEGVLGDSTAFSAVKRGVGEYMLSEYCHNDGQDGPDDADESAAAAALYAAHAYLFGCQEFAAWTSSRAVEAIDQHLEYLADQEEDELPVDTDKHSPPSSSDNCGIWTSSHATQRIFATPPWDCPSTRPSDCASN